MPSLIIIPGDKEGVKRHIFSCLDTTGREEIERAKEKKEKMEEDRVEVLTIDNVYMDSVLR